MTETQIDALKAFLNYGAPLVVKLEWRQRVLTALHIGVANRQQAAKNAAEAGDHGKAHENDVHAATLKGFLSQARMGAAWQRWLYFVDLTPDEAAWLAYVASCEAENLNAHDLHMWEIHGRPEGVIL